MICSKTLPACLVDAGPIHDESVRDDQVEGFRSAPVSGLAHAFADCLSSTELDFIAVHRLGETT